MNVPFDEAPQFSSPASVLMRAKSIAPRGRVIMQSQSELSRRYVIFESTPTDDGNVALLYLAERLQVVPNARPDTVVIIERPIVDQLPDNANYLARCGERVVAFQLSDAWQNEPDDEPEPEPEDEAEE